MVILRAVNFLKKTSQKQTSFTDKSPVDLARACTGALRHARTPQPAHKKKTARGSASRGRAPTPGPRNLNENPASEKLSGKNVKRRSPGKGVEKEPCLEGVKPLKMMIVTHFQLFFKGPWAPKKESKRKPKGTRIDKILT